MAYSLDYAVHVRNLLLTAGTIGMTHNELHQRTRKGTYTSNDLTMLIEAWKKRKWVDVYPDPRHKRRRFIRATQKLVDDWHLVVDVVDSVLIGDLPTV